ncbi:MAG: 8-oxoguanine DNA glycosylase, partial [Clostridia bacterium]|nr:8-oxoguanine DNA glycosylase [Clostridia bacterium]
GVGPKVADCISLFAYHDMNCFPVDTWVEKIYNSYFADGKPEKDRDLIRQNLVDKFLDLSGYAQQYLFYYKRELDKK